MKFRKSFDLGWRIDKTDSNKIIQINLQELVDIFLECCNNYARKDGWCILQPKRPNDVLKVAPLSREGRLAPIYWHNFDLVVP